MQTLKDNVIFISGGTRGVGKAIALRAAQDGAHLYITGKTDTPHPKLRGTIHSAAEEIAAAGAASVTPIVCDVRDLASVKQAISQAGERHGRIDALINNASALFLQPVSELAEKRYDIMQDVIVRAAYFSIQYALPYLRQSQLRQILNISPYPTLKPQWFTGHTAYTMAKYSAAMMVYGLAHELAKDEISINALWPATLLNTAAVEFVLGGEAALQNTRQPSIMADATHAILTGEKVNGQYFLDHNIIKRLGNNPDDYATVLGNKATIDIYVTPDMLE